MIRGPGRCKLTSSSAASDVDEGQAYDRSVSFFGDGTTNISCNGGLGTCPGDLDNDGFIVIGDVLLLLSDFGCTSNCVGDVNGDGAVTVSDLLDGILANFGQACP